MFLIGTSGPSSAQDVPHRHKMFLAGTSGPSSAQQSQAVPFSKKPKGDIGAFGEPSFSPGVPGDASEDICAFEDANEKIFRK
jgi:hypothetical protein